MGRGKSQHGKAHLQTGIFRGDIYDLLVVVKTRGATVSPCRRSPLPNGSCNRPDQACTDASGKKFLFGENATTKTT